MSTTNRVKTTLTRFRVLLGVPSSLVVVAFFFATLVGEMLTDAVGSVQARLVALGVLGVVAAGLVLRWDSKLRSGRIGLVDDTKLAHRRGLVVVLGLESDAPDSDVARLFTLTPRAEFVALLATPLVPGQRDVPREVESRLMPAAGMTLPSGHVKVIAEGGYQSVADFRNSTERAIDWMLSQGLNRHEIVVHVCEVSRHMLLGANQAADKARVETQIFSAPRDSNGRRRNSGTFKVVEEYL